MYIFLNKFHCLKVLEFSSLLSYVHCPISITLHGNALLNDSCQNTSEHVQENVEKVNNWDSAGVEFKQKLQLASRTSRYTNQLAPQIFY